MVTMNFQEYQKLSIRTLAPLSTTYGVDKVNEIYIEAPNDNWKHLPKMLDSVHMCLGMCSELNEVSYAIKKNDHVNISEELADTCWYLSGECHIRNIELTLDFKLLTHKLKDVEITYLLQVLNNAISEYIDLVKKEFAYRKEVKNELFILHLSVIFNSVANIANYYGINMNQALQNNIDKLYKRFPNNFNEHDAVNRNLDAERKELEK